MFAKIKKNYNLLCFQKKDYKIMVKIKYLDKNYFFGKQHVSVNLNIPELKLRSINSNV